PDIPAWALRTVLQGILLSKVNSMNLLMYMAPVAAIFLIPAVLIMEKDVVGITIALAKQDVEFLWYLIFNSSLAYFVKLTNFLHTMCVWLSSSWKCKGAIAVVVSILIFRNLVYITGMSGYTLTIIGVILYKEAKKQSK
ncbi:hypothetical protein CISIN_1g041827mg, partial [Citrus sinensis]